MSASLLWVCLAVGQGPPADFEAPPPRAVPGATVAARPPTVFEFAAAFKPAPGTYKVVMLHPRTCCPVEVCFTLPCGCPKVKVTRHELEFKYGRTEVEIHFKHNGRVKVKND